MGATTPFVTMIACLRYAAPLALMAVMASAADTYETEPEKPANYDMSCKYDAVGKDEKLLGATYDLTKLHELSKQVPVVAVDRMQIALDGTAFQYEYTFGICTAVRAPKICQKPNGDPTHGVGKRWAPVWQTNTSQTQYNTPDVNDRHCYYLGGNGQAAGLESVAAFGLYDMENPGKGVTLTYSYGQSCHRVTADSTGRRKTRINFVCDPTAGVEKVDKYVMDESAHCEYDITIKSEYACPTQCGFGGTHSMCGGHGVCGYDTDNSVARCFCNEGYSGPGCDQGGTAQETLQGYGPILGLLIFVVIALVGLVVAVLGLWRYMSQRTVPLDGSYARLDDDGSGFAPGRVSVTGADNL